MEKRKILKLIMEYYGFRKKVDFAKFLGIPPTTLASWESRNSFDYELLYDKCTAISAEFLITGKNMLRDNDVYQNNKHDLLKRVINDLSSLL